MQNDRGSDYSDWQLRRLQQDCVKVSERVLNATLNTLQLELKSVHDEYERMFGPQSAQYAEFISLLTQKLQVMELNCQVIRDFLTAAGSGMAAPAQTETTYNTQSQTLKHIPNFGAEDSLGAATPGQVQSNDFASPWGSIASQPPSRALNSLMPATWEQQAQSLPAAVTEQATPSEKSRTYYDQATTQPFEPLSAADLGYRGMELNDLDQTEVLTPRADSQVDQAQLDQSQFDEAQFGQTLSQESAAPQAEPIAQQSRIPPAASRPEPGRVPLPRPVQPSFSLSSQSTSGPQSLNSPGSASFQSISGQHQFGSVQAAGQNTASGSSQAASWFEDAGSASLPVQAPASVPVPDNGSGPSPVPAPVSLTAPAASPPAATPDPWSAAQVPAPAPAPFPVPAPFPFNQAGTANPVPVVSSTQAVPPAPATVPDAFLTPASDPWSRPLPDPWSTPSVNGPAYGRPPQTPTPASPAAPAQPQAAAPVQAANPYRGAAPPVVPYDPFNIPASSANSAPVSGAAQIPSSPPLPISSQPAVPISAAVQAPAPISAPAAVPKHEDEPEMEHFTFYEHGAAEGVEKRREEDFGYDPATAWD